MKKMFSAGLLGLIICLSLSIGQVQAGFMDAVKSAVPASDGAAAGGSLSGQDFEGLFKVVGEADGLLGNAVTNLTEMVCNKNVTEELNRKMKAAEETKDPKEREAAINKVKEDQSAALLAASEQQDTAAKLSQLSAEQKVLAANSMYNFILGGLKDKSAIELASGIVSKVQANPAAALSFKDQISRTKDLAASLPPQVNKIVQIGDNLIKLAKAGKIEVTVPKSATDAPKEAAI